MTGETLTKTECMKLSQAGTVGSAGIVEIGIEEGCWLWKVVAGEV